MRNSIRILALVFVLTITGASAMAVPAFALETTGNYNSNEVSFDSENNVTHAIGVQNFETPEPEVVLMSTDTNDSEKVVVDEPGVCEQEKANDTPVYEVGDEPMEVLVSGFDSYYITVNIKQDGYYFLNLEKLAGDDRIAIGVMDPNGSYLTHGELTENGVQMKSFLSAGKYTVYVYAFNEGDVTALFSVKYGDEYKPFDKNDYKILKARDTVNVSAGTEKLVYKLDVSKLVNSMDTFIITATGTDPRVTIRLYDENSVFLDYSYISSDGVSSELDVIPDDFNEIYYITVEQESGGSDFVLSGNSNILTISENAQPVALNEVNEISLMEHKTIVVDVNKGEEFEYIYYFGIGIHSFVPETDGYYSVNFKSDCAFDVFSFFVDSNGAMVGSEVFSYSCDKGSQAEMVVYLKAGETYSLLSPIYVEDNSKFTVEITACDKLE